MIGALSQPISTSQVSSIPGGIVTSQFFGYQGNYITSSTIDPGKGYWVKVDQDGKLILSSSLTAAGEAGTIRIVSTAELPPAPPDKISNDKVIPTEFALGQNYPNPFNPTTSIAFDVPEASIVTLKIYNMLGQEVATLLDRQIYDGATSDEADFDASSLASGVYLYRLVAVSIDEDGKETGNTFTQVKKMVLVK